MAVEKTAPSKKFISGKRIKYGLLLLSVSLLFFVWCNYYVNSFASGFLYDNPSTIPSFKYGMILGTSRNFNKTDRNTYYQNRINAAFVLYKKRKIRKIILSGTSEKFYNEPATIRKDLLRLGIPDSALILDSTGFHTLQSVNFLVREKIDSVIFISQNSQNQRAVFLARKKGIVASGYAAPDPLAEGLRNKAREFFAKGKTVWDWWVN